jgi:hypothetical protein
VSNLGQRRHSIRVVIDMPYKIICWIPVEPDEPEIYPTRKEALRVLENYALMQPENIFRIVRVHPGEYRSYSRRERIQKEKAIE